ncbi:MAG: hypothetical protein ACOYJS_07535 [Acutalibacteraceae bacterium]
MPEQTEMQNIALPQAENIAAETQNADTTPVAESADILIPVKFNKEIRNLSLEQAGNLAQKGLKFESIEKEYISLRQMAAEDKKSVPEFIAELKRQRYEEKIKKLTEKCGGDRELADHILALEEANAKSDNGFSELREHFPKFKTIDDLPASVVENSRLKGTLLLDEYLRYLFLQKRLADEAEKRIKAAEISSTGSQTNRTDPLSPETEEFLRGLWK